MTQEQLYNRTHPFNASLKGRKKLSREGSQKNTYELIIDLKDSALTYQVGDSVGIYPQNDPHVVDWTLRAMRAKGDEIVRDKADASYTLREFLLKKANITEISRKLIAEVASKQEDLLKKQKLDQLFQEHYKEELKAFINSHELWDFLEENSEVHFEPQTLCSLLMPLLPRLYSISSSQNVVGNEIHLAVAMLEYQSNSHMRRGVCTHFICNLAAIGESHLPIYIQPHHGFTVPEDSNRSLIMVGPGTGVAPFRAFMQERIYQKAKGKHWLFFGEWSRAFDYFYEDYWEELQSQGHLKVDLAFSRDQQDKVYVQHRMWETGKELFQWLEEGACFYVCGDAQKMAKDVEAILLQVIQLHGKLDEAGAKAYLKNLRTEKRYLRDVY